MRTMTQQVACARARGLAAQFGYYPVRCDIQNGRFSVETLPDLDSRVADVAENENVHSGWIYAGAEQVRDFMTGNVTVMPYSARVFPLPKTHVLTIKKCESRDHLELVVWCLSFFIGMRLTTTEAGFLDATPVEPGKLVDFSLGRYTVEDVIVIALNFLDAYRKTPPAYKILPAVIHALFLAQYPQSLDFERFQYLYMALDACYKLMTVNDTPPSRSGHAARIQWMCEKFTVPVPEWAKVEKSRRHYRSSATTPSTKGSSSMSRWDSRFTAAAFPTLIEATCHWKCGHLFVGCWSAFLSGHRFSTSAPQSIPDSGTRSTGPRKGRNITAAQQPNPIRLNLRDQSRSPDCITIGNPDARGSRRRDRGASPSQRRPLLRDRETARRG